MGTRRHNLKRAVRQHHAEQRREQMLRMLAANPELAEKFTALGEALTKAAEPEATQ